MNKEEIIKNLKKQGKTCKQIAMELGCSVPLVYYYLWENRKDKARINGQKQRKQNPIAKKIGIFKVKTKLSSSNKKHSDQKINIIIKNKIQSFKGKNRMGNDNFRTQDVLDKLGENPKCYLTGEDIDLTKSRSYHFDHIIPRSKGGSNTLDNLGVCTSRANQAKHDLTPDEFLQLCKNILEHNGYEVIRNQKVEF